MLRLGTKHLARQDFLKRSCSLLCSRKISSTSACKSVYSKQFYKVNKTEIDDRYSFDQKSHENSLKYNVSSSEVVGEVIDNAVNLMGARPGDSVEVPYEITVSPSFRDFWQSAFYSHDRINTSTVFARNLGLQDQIVPFSLMLFLAGSMSHADHAKVQVRNYLSYVVNYIECSNLEPS